MPINPTVAVSTANSFAAQNGIHDSEITSTTVAGNQMSITMHLTRTVPYYFALVIGLSSGQVTANATAGLPKCRFGQQEMMSVGIDSRTTYTYERRVDLLTGYYSPGN